MLVGRTEEEATVLARARGLELTGMRRFLETPSRDERVELGFAGFRHQAIYRATARLGAALAEA